MKWRKSSSQLPDPCVEAEKDARLEDAEKRVNVLVATAEWIHNAVAKRDQENHWQASVNQLFQGGQP